MCINKTVAITIVREWLMTVLLAAAISRRLHRLGGCPASRPMSAMLCSKGSCVKQLWASRGRASPELAQQGEGVPVRPGLRILGRLESHGDPVEAPVRHQPAEGLFAEPSPADLLVTVEARAQRRFRVVQMKGPHVPEPHDPGAGRDDVAITLARAQVVAGGEEMTRVETDAEALGRAGAAQKRCQLLEASPDGRAAAGRVLEQDTDAVAAGPRRHLVELRDDAPNALVETQPPVRSRVDDHEGQAERLG